MPPNFNYAKALKILGIVCGASLLVLILSTILVMAGGSSTAQPDMAVTGSIFAVQLSCLVAALSFVALVVTLVLRRRAAGPAPETKRTEP